MKLAPDSIRATVAGINEIVDRVPVLTRLTIEYELKIPAGTREVVDRALESHQSKCPSAQSFKDSIEITWTAAIEEVD